MSEFRFFGTESVINGATLSRYGQVVEMDEPAANALIAEHPPALLIPESLWQKAGITDAELAEFPSAIIHGSAPEEFRTKTHAVRAAYHEYRGALIEARNPRPVPDGGFGKPPVPAAPVAEAEPPAAPAAPIAQPAPAPPVAEATEEPVLVGD